MPLEMYRSYGDPDLVGSQCIRCCSYLRFVFAEPSTYKVYKSSDVIRSRGA